MAQSDHAKCKVDTGLPRLRRKGIESDGLRRRTKSSSTTKARGLSSGPYVSQLSSCCVEENELPYPLSAEKGHHVGVCLVLNVLNFSTRGFEKRHGSEKDAERIRTTFEHFGFDVIEKRDPTRTKMKEILKRLAENYKKEWKCFVCFLLSHGNTEDVIYDTEGSSVRISELVLCFNNKACPQMAGKPKLFFVQMCRGKDYQEGVEDKTMMRDCHIDGPTLLDTPIPPNEPDMLVGFGTTPGYVSFRFSDEGSPYIQTLLEMISTVGEKDDIYSVMRRTTKRVGLLDFNANYKMCPCFYSSLCRPLIFSSHTEISGGHNRQVSEDRTRNIMDKFVHLLKTIF